MVSTCSHLHVDRASSGPLLRSLAGGVGESVSASVLEGADTVYIALAPIRQIMNINIALGTRLPASATSMGRVHLSRLDPNEVVRRLEFPLLPFTPHTVTGQEAVPGAS